LNLQRDGRNPSRWKYLISYLGKIADSADPEAESYDQRLGSTGGLGVAGVAVARVVAQELSEC
jgi:hypothetical protein